MVRGQPKIGSETCLSVFLGQISPEQFGNPVVFPEEEDVHGSEEGVLVGPLVSGHKVVRPFGPLAVRIRPNVELLSSGKLVGV